MSTTPIWSRPYPELGDIADVPVWMHDLAVNLENVPPVSSGTLAARPTSSPVTPGKEGRRHLVLGDPNPDNNNIEWLDTGAGWIQIGGVVDPAAGVPGQRTLGPGSQQAAPGDLLLQDVYASRPAASAALNGRRFVAIDKLTEYQCIAGAWVLVAATPTKSNVATPPSSPVEGQLWEMYNSSTSGVNWLFRYNSDLARWDCIGGGRTFVASNALVTTGSTTQGVLGSAPAFITGWAGGWEIDHGCEAHVVSGSIAAVQNVIVAGSLVSNDILETESASFISLGRYIGAKASVPASSTITLANYVSNTGSGGWQRRWLAVKPTYIG